MKRKLFKLLILTIIVSIFIFIVYKLNRQNKINVVMLGDRIANNNYLINELRKNDRLGTYNNYYIKEETINSLNDRIKNTSNIKKDLRESELTIISIGLNDFYNSLDNNINTKNILDLKDNISILLPKLDKLLNEIRKYAKYDVVLIGYYNPVPFLFNTDNSELDILFMYIEGMIKDLTKKYDITYLSLYNQFKNNDYVDEKYPNMYGYQAIGNLILNHVKQN